MDTSVEGVASSYLGRGIWDLVHLCSAEVQFGVSRRTWKLTWEG
jgi:hypothetical protein